MCTHRGAPRSGSGYGGRRRCHGRCCAAPNQLATRPLWRTDAFACVRSTGCSKVCTESRRASAGDSGLRGCGCTFSTCAIHFTPLRVAHREWVQPWFRMKQSCLDVVNAAAVSVQSSSSKPRSAACSLRQVTSDSSSLIVLLCAMWCERALRVPCSTGSSIFGAAGHPDVVGGPRTPHRTQSQFERSVCSIAAQPKALHRIDGPPAGTSGSVPVVAFSLQQQPQHQASAFRSETKHNEA